MMKIAAYILLAIVITGSSCMQQKEQYPSGIAHVIVIGVDGMSPDGIRHAQTPVMHRMMAAGAVKWNVRTVLPSSSSPNWASMIMGAGPEQHGVLDNDWERDEHSLPPVTMGEEGIFPTIFGVVRNSNPDAEIGAVYHWHGFGRLFEKKAVSYDKNFSTEDSTAAGFIDYIIKRRPLFAFVHFDNVDHAGHHDGHGTPGYYQAVSKTDSLIGKILEGIKTAGIEENTLVIVTADHGGKGYGHGGPTVEEAEIAMILYGKDVKKNYLVKQPVYTYDLAATIAFALHIVPPYAWIGRPLKSAFEGFSEPADPWKGKQLIAAPVIYPAPYLYQQAGGLFVDTPALVKMEPVAPQSTIRYTLDGTDPGAASALYKAPFVLDSTAVVKARSFDGQGNESLVTAAYFRVLHSGAPNGLHAAFYPGKDWSSLPVFSKLSPTKQWTSHEFNVDRRQILPLLEKDNNVFGIVYTGYIDIDRPGKYTFYLQSDDGSKLYINDKKVVDNDGGHGVLEKAEAVQLEKGRLPIRVEFFNAEGGFWLDAFYKGPGLAKQIIPADKLFLQP